MVHNFCKALSPSKGGVSGGTVKSKTTRNGTEINERYHFEFEGNVARIEANRRFEKYFCTN